LRRALLLLTLLCLPADLPAQLEPAGTGGVVAREQALRHLGHAKRVLVIGAHPDDEDTELLTLLTRGEGAEAAYLSLNRGEGGQNLIGAELGELLGVLRTEELLAARRLDGAQQYFTRAYDFGYSRTLEDTWAHWARDTLLADVVRVVRAFQPQVVVSVFAGTPRDGHGQHQAAGWLAREAFRLAGDTSAFPDQLGPAGLAPWAPAKLYRSARFDSAATTLVLEGGRVDDLSGRTYHQIAMASRSLHRSQDMGQLQTIGPSPVRLALLEDRSGKGAASFWAGTDTSLAGAGGKPDSKPGRQFASYADKVEKLRRTGREPTTAQLRELAAALDKVRLAIAGETSGPRAAWLTALDSQRRWLAEAMQATAGVLVDVWADDSLAVPGSTIGLAIDAHNASAEPAEVRVSLGGAVDDTSFAFVLAPGARASERVRMTVRASAPPTMVLQRRATRDTALYERDDWLGRPAGEEPVGGLVARVALGGEVPFRALERPVTHRRNDQSRGEVRTPVTVVPRLDVALLPAESPWRMSEAGVRTFRVRLRHAARDTTRGVARLTLPPGWAASPQQRFALIGQGAEMELRFTVRPPARRAAGTVLLRAEVDDEAGRGYEAGRRTLAHPHTRPRTVFEPAESRVVTLDLAMPALRRIGYVRGASDLVPEALEAAGFPVEVLAPGAIAEATLARYDVIVIGPRAYETDPGLAAATPRLLAWVRAGGRVVTQYQQYAYFLEGHAPFPLFAAARPFGRAAAPDVLVGPGTKLGGPPSLLGGHDRVTDERAPVAVLRAGEPALARPNRIVPADWDGWVQERGLYFAREWDKAWRPVIATSDPGDTPLAGGLLVARVGKGSYVYTGLSFFRQLPAGVPGAFRLFANLLDLR
jgi:LmbE family N-acetylglucosaminyl deacetylase